MATETKGMISPVVCTHCGEIYDLTEAKVIHRYSDCTLFTTPCCGRQADDRQWKGMPDFTRWTPEMRFTNCGIDGSMLRGQT